LSTPLHVAVRYLQCDAMKLLLQFAGRQPALNMHAEVAKTAAAEEGRRAQAKLEAAERRAAASGGGGGSEDEGEGDADGGCAQLRALSNRDDLGQTPLLLCVKAAASISKAGAGGKAAAGAPKAAVAASAQAGAAATERAEGLRQARRVSLGMVQQMIARGAPVDVPDEDGMTPLHHAADMVWRATGTHVREGEGGRGRRRETIDRSVPHFAHP
jgi:ankyrin repeat protein